MSRILALPLLVGLAACTTDSTVKTGETWAPPTAAQDAAFQAGLPNRVNPYLLKRPPPQMDRNGCATSVRKEDGKLVIPAFHPDETYCIRVAALGNTTLELPPGARLQDMVSAMGQYLDYRSSSTAERDVILLTGKCVPAAKDEAGNLKPAELHEFIDQSALPFCPPRRAELTVVLSTGIAQFKLYLYSSSHDKRVVMEEAELEPMQVGIPIRPSYARDLYATSLSDEMIPWTPDDAWSDGTQTVLVWHRPMPTLPAMMMGPTGEQRANPRIVNHQGSIAMIYPQLMTRFQLRIDDRALGFSDEPPPSPLFRRVES